MFGTARFGLIQLRDDEVFPRPNTAPPRGLQAVCSELGFDRAETFSRNSYVVFLLDVMWYPGLANKWRLLKPFSRYEILMLVR